MLQAGETVIYGMFKLWDTIQSGEVFCGQCGKPAIYGTIPSQPFSMPEPTFSQDALGTITSLPPPMPESTGSITPIQKNDYSLFQPLLSNNYPILHTSNPLPTYEGGSDSLQSGQSFSKQQHSHQNNQMVWIAALSLLTVAVLILGTLFILSHNFSRPGWNPPPNLRHHGPFTLTEQPKNLFTPTALPTSPPDTRFTWCNQLCAPNGFQVEFPSGWEQRPPSTGPGAQFVNNDKPEMIAIFKSLSTSPANANVLVNDDLASYQVIPGYTPPNPKDNGTTTIGGENWIYMMAKYTINDQPVHITVLGTVHKGKGYLIELQSFEKDYNQANQTYFVPMTGRFQFL